MRHIVGPIEWARPAVRPPGMPVGRPRGRKAAGVRYERALGKQLVEEGINAKHGAWWQWRDSSGVHYCQTDFILDLGIALLVLEAKYTWVAEGDKQLAQLYLPILEAATRRHIWGLQVCRVLTPESPRATHNLGEAITFMRRDSVVWPGGCCLHWRGQTLGPLMALSLASRVADPRGPSYTSPRGASEIGL